MGTFYHNSSISGLKEPTENQITIFSLPLRNHYQAVMVFKPNKTVNENKTKYSMKSATEFLIACIRIAVIPKHLMQFNTFVRSLELKLEVCSSLSYWLFDLNNTVVDCKNCVTVRSYRPENIEYWINIE